MNYTAQETAARLAKAMNKKNENSPITRFQLSLKGISELSKSDFVDEHFLMSLTSELRNYSWCMFRVSNTTYSFIQLDSARKFRKLSGDGLSGLLEGLES